MTSWAAEEVRRQERRRRESRGEPSVEKIKVSPTYPNPGPDFFQVANCLWERDCVFVGDFVGGHCNIERPRVGSQLK